MASQVLQIQRKRRERPNSIVSPQDFEWLGGEAIEASTILNNPQASLYCLDLENRCLIFVETPADQDLLAAPFYYQAQYEAAQRLFAVPFQDLTPLMAPLEQAMTQPLVWIYSVGRCGSTLLSRLFQQVEGVLSLSEPDVFSQLVAFRNRERGQDAEIVKLLKLCVTLLCRPALDQSSVSPARRGTVIKFRSYGIELADLLAQAFPKSKAIFLYRDVRAVVKSSIRAYTELAKRRYVIQQNVDTYSLLIPLLKQYADWIDFDDKNATDLYTVMWLSVMERYLQFHQQKIPMIVLRYEDLIDRPESTLEALFHYCRLDVNIDAEMDRVRQVLGQDSQQGSNLSRTQTRNRIELQDDEIERRICRLLSHHPLIQSPDFIPPVGL